MFEFDAVSFCCPEMVPATPSICQFCPDGTSVMDPGKIISSGYGPSTCGEIQESIELIPTAASCDYTKSKFGIDLCCTSGESTASTWMWRGVMLLPLIVVWIG